MSIQVEHEDIDDLKAWGMGLESVVERCVFCKERTRYWYVQKNKPCCQSCAATKNHSDFDEAVK